MTDKEVSMGRGLDTKGKNILIVMREAAANNTGSAAKGSGWGQGSRSLCTMGNQRSHRGRRCPELSEPTSGSKRSPWFCPIKSGNPPRVEILPPFWVPVIVLHYLSGKKVIPEVQPEPAKLQFVAIAPCYITCYYWEDFGSIVFVTTFQILVGNKYAQLIWGVN